MIVCVVGGATVWQHVCANTVERMLGEPDEASRGLSKFAWFSALNISARNCRLNLSVNWKRLPIPRSRFQYPGASKMLRRAIRSRRRDGKRAGVLENDRTDHTRHFLQANLRFGADDIRTRLVREVGRADAAANAERLSGHERVYSVEAPAADDMVPHRMNRRSEPFLSSNRELPE